jgi:hypothetical protein
MDVHIGQEIERKFQDSGLKLTVFADKINTGERNVYSIFKRRDISAEMLRKISNVLNYNFFELYEQGLEEGLVQEPSIKYKVEASAISLALNVSVSKSKLDHISAFIREVGQVAQKHGLVIL